MLRTTGSRVLVTPDTAASETDAGLVIPESARKEPPMSGRVVAVGNGPASAHAVRKATIKRCLAIVEDKREPCGVSLTLEAGYRLAVAHLFSDLKQYADETAAMAGVGVGDRVVFPYTAGTALTVDGEPYIVLHEDQIEAVWTQEETHE